MESLCGLNLRLFYVCPCQNDFIFSSNFMGFPLRRYPEIILYGYPR